VVTAAVVDVVVEGLVVVVVGRLVAVGAEVVVVVPCPLDPHEAASTATTATAARRASRCPSTLCTVPAWVLGARASMLGTLLRRAARIVYLVERWGWGGAPGCPASVVGPALKAGFAVVMVGGVVSDAGDLSRGLGEPRRTLARHA
jgi:hypothetical protein